MTKLMRLKPAAMTRVVDDYVTSGSLPSDWARFAEPIGRDVDIELIQRLSRHAVERFEPDKVDAWLAPRLHYSFRIQRRLASDVRLWAWLALNCNEFINHRFGKGSEVHPWRYNGTLLRNGLSRLWWGAEMCRNGSDYSDVETVFARTRTAEFALELMYSWNRPAAIAFARVGEGKDGGERLTDPLTVTLSTRLRIYLSLRSLEAAHMGDIEDTEEFDAEWAAHTTTLREVLTDDLTTLRGPSVGVADDSAIQELQLWMRSIVDEIKPESNEAEVAA